MSFSRFSRRYDHPGIRRRRRIIHHPQSVGAGRADIRDIAARREEGRRDRCTARERDHDHPDQCAARVREARSSRRQGTRSGELHVRISRGCIFTRLRGAHKRRPRLNTD